MGDSRSAEFREEANACIKNVNENSENGKT